MAQYRAGLDTLSRYKVTSAERRSYPVDDSFIVKFTDLDRCFAVLRLPVTGHGQGVGAHQLPHVGL